MSLIDGRRGLTSTELRSHIHTLSISPFPFPFLLSRSDILPSLLTKPNLCGRPLSFPSARKRQHDNSSVQETQEPPVVKTDLYDRPKTCPASTVLQWWEEETLIKRLPQASQGKHLAARKKPSFSSPTNTRKAWARGKMGREKVIHSVCLWARPHTRREEEADKYQSPEKKLLRDLPKSSLAARRNCSACALCDKERRRKRSSGESEYGGKTCMQRELAVKGWSSLRTDTCNASDSSTSLPLSFISWHGLTAGRRRGLDFRTPMITATTTATS